MKKTDKPVLKWETLNTVREEDGFLDSKYIAERAKVPGGWLVIAQFKIGSSHVSGRRVRPLVARAMFPPTSGERSGRATAVNAFVGTNGRCSETGCLESHHVVPFAAGGATTVENLQLRCRSHNAYEAAQYFGSGQPWLVREDRGASDHSDSVRPEFRSPFLAHGDSHGSWDLSHREPQ